jgi:hypothetical protein
MEAHVEGHGDQQPREYDAEDAQSQSPKWALKALLVARHANALPPKQQVPEVDGRRR